MNCAMNDAKRRAPAQPLVRKDLLARLGRQTEWDVIVIGGGATGLGCALDAAARGLKTVLLEAHDFAHGSSSRSTKLIHGGVRYLAQMNFSLVREALHERTLLLRNGPADLVHPLGFVIPIYRWSDLLVYAAGLKLYDALAGSDAIAASRAVRRKTVLELTPGVALHDAGGRSLKAGIHYFDAQFDDSRLAISLLRTAAAHGAVALNYCPVTALLKRRGKVCGVTARDAESGQSMQLRARAVINATGVWVDGLRLQDDALAQPMVAPSQGAHLVLDRDFLPGDCALLQPRTADGRVLFCIPWLGKTLIGTTDTVRDDLPQEPLPQAAEIDFLLDAAAALLARRPTRADIRAQFAGLRPLVKAAGGMPTSRLSREHAIVVSASGLITVTGGKWTTYRMMAEQVIDLADRTAQLGAAPSPTKKTRLLPLHYEAAGGPRLHPDFPYTEQDVRNAFHFEMARVADDILLRRTRLGLLDAHAAQTVRPVVEALLACCRAQE